MKYFQIQKEEFKLFVFVDAIILYIECLNHSTKIFISQFAKLVGYVYNPHTEDSGVSMHYKGKGNSAFIVT